MDNPRHKPQQENSWGVFIRIIQTQFSLQEETRLPVCSSLWEGKGRWHIAQTKFTFISPTGHLLTREPYNEALLYLSCCPHLLIVILGPRCFVSPHLSLSLWQLPGE